MWWGPRRLCGGVDRVPKRGALMAHKTSCQARAGYHEQQCMFLDRWPEDLPITVVQVKNRG